MADDPILHLSIPVDDLGTARAFYETVLGCPIGRTRDDWIDVWFFGCQLTLQERPDEARPPERQGVAHFGATFPDRADFDRVVERARAHGARRLTEPSAEAAAALSGKVAGKLADPSGNVIELKHYPDVAGLRAG